MDATNPTLYSVSNSQIQKINIFGKNIYLKRDDLISLEFSGNKFRKLSYYLDSDFLNIESIVSYGGIQSNMMYSLSCLAKIRNWQFIYYTKNISNQVKILKEGNYFSAIQNGMHVHELKDNYNNFISRFTPNSNQLLIPQGGHQIESKYGIDILGQELLEWAKSKYITNFNVFLPSGTGTSALYLQQKIKPNIVYTTNCVGGVEYLRKQFFELSPNLNDHPYILENKKFRFAELNLELLEMFRSLRTETNVEFDLLYDPVGWHILIENFEELRSYPTIYIHCGGTLGNKTQLMRYEYFLSKKNH